MARSGYVARVRQLIGHELLMLHAVSVFVFDDQGRFLMAQQNGSDQWVTIGGAVEIGETPADTAMREFWEETGALIRVRRVLGIFGGPDFQITYPNGDAVAYTSVAVEADLVSGAPKPDGAELKSLRWIAKEELAALSMLPGMRIVTTQCAERYPHVVFQPASWVPPA